MSALGKVYLLVSLGLVVLGLLWAVMTLRDNAAWVPITLWIPSPGAWTDAGLWQPRHYDVSASALLAGWLTTLGLMTMYAIRAPFRIRAAAVAQRRLRGLEREVLELRTLPLRQAEEDDMLAAEARLDVGQQRVMQEHYVVSPRGTAADRGDHHAHQGDRHGDGRLSIRTGPGHAATPSTPAAGAPGAPSAGRGGAA